MGLHREFRVDWIHHRRLEQEKLEVHQGFRMNPYAVAPLHLNRLRDDSPLQSFRAHGFNSSHRRSHRPSRPQAHDGGDDHLVREHGHVPIHRELLRGSSHP